MAYGRSESDSDITENTNMQIEGLTQETRDLRPDITFRRRDNQGMVWEIIEFSCPYGYRIRDGNTFEYIFQQKQQKDGLLAQKIRDITQGRVWVSSIIVSSLGTIYLPSQKQ
jgi:hypothetical protein